MEEQEIIEKLIELDDRAFDINTERRKRLTKMSNRYKEEEQETINQYRRRTEEQVKTVTQKILEEGQKEVGQIKFKNKEILQSMEQEFEESVQNMIDEIIKRIFHINSENNG